MKFADLLSLQKPPQNQIIGRATAIAALNPRSRMDFSEECELDAKDLISKQSVNSTKNLQNVYNIYINKINTQKTQTCIDVFETSIEHCNALQIKKSKGLHKQKNSQNKALEKLISTKLSVVSDASDSLLPLKATNQFESLTDVIRGAPKTALPFRFRILTRANYAYGENNWSEALPNDWVPNTAENFYDLLIGNAPDTYHSDFEPVQTQFLQGSTGSFLRTQLFSIPTPPTIPMAAVGAFSLKNISTQVQVGSIQFDLSCGNFSAVFLKIDAWTQLFQTTTNSPTQLLGNTGIQTATFTVPAGQMATIMLVSTPYLGYFAHYGSELHDLQFLQWGVFNVREMFTNNNNWAWEY
jgi:hypothetical protein